MSRRNADAVIALAIVHHLAIGRNIPLPFVVEWLVGLAPRGVVEFVPKSDLMVQRMLRLRRDILRATTTVISSRRFAVMRGSCGGSSSHRAAARCTSSSG